jgi:aminopeptidase N
MKKLTALLLTLTLAACAPPTPTAPAPFIEPALSEAEGTAAPPTSLPSPTATLLPTLPPTAALEPTITPTASAGGQSAGDGYAPEMGNSGYDAQHYDLKLSLDPAVTFVEASATIRAVSQVHNLIQLTVDFSGFDIHALTVDGVPAEYSRNRGKLTIALPAPLHLGQAFEISVDYSGVPVQTGSAYVPFIHHLGLQFLGANLYALNEPDGAHYWYPCNDTPLDKAAYTIALTVPAGLEGIANGRMMEETASGGVTTFTWDNPYPTASYAVTLAVGDYELISGTSPGGIPIEHYIFEDIRQPFLDAAGVTGEALDWLGSLFGEYPFETFGFVTTRLIRASLETQGRVILSENMLNEETVIHEIAHMWFGDWVTMESWSDMWHTEGFAVYLSLMWQTREQPGALNIFMQNLAAEVEREGSADPLGHLAPQRIYGFDSYQRGALMIHHLRLTLGDEAFFAGLRLYFERYGGGTASRAEFIAVMEEAGGMELDAFFAEWLE